MVDSTKQVGTAEDQAVRTELCEKVQDLFDGRELSVCMDVLTALIVPGALALGQDREQFLVILGEAYDVVAELRATQKESAN